MEINAKTKTTCLFGHPVEHSFSPVIHNYLYRKYKENIIYECFDISKEDLKAAVEAVRVLGIIGLNVTIPHKVEIMKYLDFLDIKSKLVGAVNTIKNEGGALKGYNTDGIGFVQSIFDIGYSIKGKKILILGAGGACRSISIELAVEGAKSIEIRNRSLDNANHIVETINSNFETKAHCSKKEVDKDDLEGVDIIINATPIGMKSDNCPIDKNITIDKAVLVCDIVYNPHNTSLIKWAKSQNIETMYGIDMLVNQGLAAFKIWTGINPTIEDKEILKNMYNCTI